MIKVVILISLLLLLPSDIWANNQWNLVWNDEFNGIIGTPPDPSKWTYEKIEHNHNGELQYYTDHPDNASLDGSGHLIIRAIREDFGDRRYTSARLNTVNKFERTYGFFEARIKIPSGKGIWPAFWMLGSNRELVGNPACGEIDIMENIGNQLFMNNNALHGPGYSGSHGLSQRTNMPFLLSDGFHVYGVEWAPNRARFYVDGVTTATFTINDLPRGTKWVFDHPMYMILNLAVGGQWPGSPDESTQFPAEMIVDYVRVYRK